MDFFSKLHKLTSSELEELLVEIGDKFPASVLEPLRTEQKARTLMDRLPGLKRPQALLMVRCDNTELPFSALGKDIAHWARLNNLDREELETMLAFCGAYGQKVLSWAVAQFDKDPVEQGKDQAVEMLLLAAQDRRDGAEAVDGEEVADEFDAGAEQLPGLKLREHLSSRWGIDSAEDFEMMIDAMHVIRKENRSSWLNGSREVQNSLTLKARKLYEQSRSKRCSPSKLVEWRALDWGEKYRNEIRVRPWDNVRLWGNGDLVITNDKGESDRVMPNIFGTEAAQSDIPDDMADMVRKAYPDFYR